MNILIAIVIFSLIILFHELGHFLLAKANHIRVNEFSLGLGPTILGFTKGETKYCLKLLPFGGSCVMNEDEEADEKDEHAFNNKSVWARMSVVVAGPVFNFIMAFILALIVIIMVGYDRPVVSYLYEGETVASEAGLKEGDLILKVNGNRVHLAKDVALYQTLYPADDMELLVERNEDGKQKQLTVDITPVRSENLQIGIYLKEGKSEIEEVIDDTIAQKAGLKANDIIKAVDGKVSNSDTGAIELIRGSNGKEITLTIERDGKEKEVSLTPQTVTTYSHGFASDSNLNRVRGGIGKTILNSFYELEYWIKMTMKSLKMLISGEISVKKMSGPVGIVSIIGKTYNQSKSDGAFFVLLNMMNLAILLSANLGVMNLLPIPALDGGRIVFFIIEAIRRKRMPQKIEATVHLVGFVLLMLLMVLVMSQDIYKLFK